LTFGRVIGALEGFARVYGLNIHLKIAVVYYPIAAGLDGGLINPNGEAFPLPFMGLIAGPSNFANIIPIKG
jgi:hypothetical protein